MKMQEEFKFRPTWFVKCSLNTFWALPIYLRGEERKIFHINEFNCFSEIQKVTQISYFWSTLKG